MSFFSPKKLSKFLISFCDLNQNYIERPFRSDSNCNRSYTSRLLNTRVNTHRWIQAGRIEGFVLVRFERVQSEETALREALRQARRFVWLEYTIDATHGRDRAVGRISSHIQNGLLFKWVYNLFNSNSFSGWVQHDCCLYEFLTSLQVGFLFGLETMEINHSLFTHSPDARNMHISLPPSTKTEPQYGSNAHV